VSLDEPPGTTVRFEVPSDETGPVPVSVSRAETRLFGVPPLGVLLALAAGAFIVAIIFFAVGRWPYALILVGVGALLVAAFLEGARRRPRSRLTRTSIEIRERAGSAWETWRTRATVAAEVRRIRSGLAALESERRTALLELGEAAFRGDAAAESAARAKLVAQDEHAADLHRQLDAALAEAGERIRKARLPVQETVLVLPEEPSPPPGEATPPGPARVPEPYPPPGEATPPEPARVPEPHPPPDEATPPQPAPAPERDDDK
jgi:hypothetical protein